MKILKRIGIVLLSLVVVLFIAFQIWVVSISDVEEQPYEVVATYDNVEIRKYPPARMISVQNSNQNSREVSNSSFGVLAGYIFGGNSEQQEIAMTAPVHMHESDSGTRMSFVLPEELWESELPRPNSNRVQIHWSDEEYVAAIQYGGFSSAADEVEYETELTNTLQANNIATNGDFRQLGYDPPFKFFNRRNEVIVSINPASL